jgi:adenosylcobinamide-GDP ribazoletransferase
MNPLWIALSTLTLIPVSVADPKAADLKRSVIFYPLVGALLGFLLFLLHLLPIGHDLQALVILVAWVSLTGAFHLDGLGDCLDGWFGGRDPKERLRIMKTADLGTYGMTGIALTLIAKYVLLDHLLAQDHVDLLTSQTRAGLWLIAIPAAARWAVCFACSIGKPLVGNKGLGSQVLGLSGTGLLLTTLMTLVLIFPLKYAILAVFLIAAMISAGVSGFSRLRIGGLTGDGMGAMIELSEVGLLLFACLSHA